MRLCANGPYLKEVGMMPAVIGECVYLVRHARTALNADGRLRGHLDPPLDGVGRREADDLAIVLASLRPVRVVSSPLRRAVETAQAIATRASVPVVIDQRLCDRDYGPWAGESEDAVVLEWGALDMAPGVERAESVLARARAALDAQLGAGGSVVLVSHEAVNRALLRQLDPELGARDGVSQRTACWNLLVHVDGAWDVERVDQKVE
jgi:broad specificity phosphatase PhoE